MHLKLLFPNSQDFWIILTFFISSGQNQTDNSTNAVTLVSSSILKYPTNNRTDFKPFIESNVAIVIGHKNNFLSISNSIIFRLLNHIKPQDTVGKSRYLSLFIFQNGQQIDTLNPQPMQVKRSICTIESKSHLMAS